MRTNIDIDDALLTKAMHTGPYSTKKETVEAGLRLLTRQAAYREILKWKGKLKWEGDESIDWTQPAQGEIEAQVGPLTQELRSRWPLKQRYDVRADATAPHKRTSSNAVITEGGGKKIAARHAGR